MESPEKSQEYYELLDITIKNALSLAEKELHGMREHAYVPFWYVNVVDKKVTATFIIIGYDSFSDLDRAQREPYLKDTFGIDRDRSHGSIRKAKAKGLVFGGSKWEVFGASPDQYEWLEWTIKKTGSGREVAFLLDEHVKGTEKVTDYYQEVHTVNYHVLDDLETGQCVLYGLSKHSDGTVLIGEANHPEDQGEETGAIGAGKEHFYVFGTPQKQSNLTFELVKAEIGNIGFTRDVVSGRGDRTWTYEGRDL